MEEFVQKLMAKVGLDRGQAEGVFNFLRENAQDLPRLLGSGGDGGLKEKLQSGLGGIMGR